MELAENNKLKKIVKLVDNNTPKLQGEAYLRISPFDDYFMFTLNSLVDGENIPINLVNMGTFYLSFFDQNQEIKIPNYTNIKDLEIDKGQVVFRISKEDSKRILSINNNVFYISNRMEDGDEVSDESVIYTGKFIKFDEFSEKVLSDKITELETTKNEEINNLLDKIASLEETILKLEEDKVNLNNSLQNEILKNNNLVDGIESIKNKLTQEEITKINTVVEKNITKIKDSKKLKNPIKSVKGLENTSAILNKENSKPIKRQDLDD
jgi:hypothetical protein